MNIHECVKFVIGDDLWNSKPYQLLYQAILSHLKDSEDVKIVLRHNKKLNLNHVGAMVYYTADVRLFGGNKSESLYKLLNPDLITKDSRNIQKWNPFLFYAIQSKEFFPKYKGISYRGIDKPLTTLSKQYKQGNLVTWVAFTSTTKNKNVIKNFSSNDNGSWLIIEGNDGIELPFSLFPLESEVLYFPNSTFLVTAIITNNMKELMQSPQNLDIFELKQTI